MKLFIMTDLEGVAGVLDFDHWLTTEGCFHEVGRRLLTEEVNAAVDAFAEGGFDDIVVCDGHGHGSINIEMLDERAKLLRGVPLEFGPYTSWPMGVDESYDAIAFVGQHAKAGTEYSHLTHSGNMNMLDITVNGISVGEYGQLVLCAGERNVPVIFAAGEKALCQEAEKLTPWVVTAAVKEGNIPWTGNDLPMEEYRHFHQGAVHLQPRRARHVIHTKAREAAQAFNEDPARFKPLTLPPPYETVYKVRPSTNKNRLDRISVSAQDPDHISRAMNKAKEEVEKIFKT